MSVMSNIATLLDTDWTRFDVFGRTGYMHKSGRWIARDGETATLDSVEDGWRLGWVMNADLHTIVHYVDMVERER